MQQALSIEETRAVTGIGRTKLYEAINSGELRARKLGKRTLILQSDLESFLSKLQDYSPVRGHKLTLESPHSGIKQGE
jgi:excisionase family DNA binding protein